MARGLLDAGAVAGPQKIRYDALFLDLQRYNADPSAANRTALYGNLNAVKAAAGGDPLVLAAFRQDMAPKLAAAAAPGAPAAAAPGVDILPATGADITVLLGLAHGVPEPVLVGGALVANPHGYWLAAPARAAAPAVPGAAPAVPGAAPAVPGAAPAAPGAAVPVAAPAAPRRGAPRVGRTTEAERQEMKEMVDSLKENVDGLSERFAQNSERALRSIDPLRQQQEMFKEESSADAKKSAGLGVGFLGATGLGAGLLVLGVSTGGVGFLIAGPIVLALGITMLVGSISKGMDAKSNSAGADLAKGSIKDNLRVAQQAASGATALAAQESAALGLTLAKFKKGKHGFNDDTVNAACKAITSDINNYGIAKPGLLVR